MENPKLPAKHVIFFISVILISPILVLYWLLRIFFKSDSLFSGFSQFLGLLPGKTGTYLRAGFYRYTMSKCSNDVVISFLVLFAQQDTEIDSGVYIGPSCNIGTCKIGKNTLIGSGVHIMSGKRQHVFDDPERDIKDQGGMLQKISIGEDCWIGNGALILANVGNKCVVGSGSVVTNDLPAYSIVAGNPAKIVRSRNI
jgi:acetyltransferase-like isoleucine patch superfamily enzyme